MFAHTPDYELKRLLKLDHAELRARQALAWRRLRRDRPEMAKLLFRRMKRAEREGTEAAAKLIFGETQ